MRVTDGRFVKVAEDGIATPFLEWLKSLLPEAPPPAEPDAAVKPAPLLLRLPEDMPFPKLKARQGQPSKRADTSKQQLVYCPGGLWGAGVYGCVKTVV